MRHIAGRFLPSALLPDDDHETNKATSSRGKKRGSDGGAPAARH
jgi:hypothetical protein